MNRSRGKKNLRAAACIITAFMLISVPANPFRTSPVWSDSSSPVKVDIYSFAEMTESSSYYAWKGKVILEGSVSEADFTSEYLAFYLDENIMPFAKAEKADMEDISGGHTFSVLLDTDLYKEGRHSITVYDGEKTGEPLIDFKAFFSNKPYASVTNVSDYCNMRASPTTSSAIVTGVNLNEVIEVTGSVKGQYRSEYNTDLWYRTKYTNKLGTVYEGYIISALVSVNAIEEISFSAVISEDTVETGSTEEIVLEEFNSMKSLYTLFLPEDITHFRIDDIVRLAENDMIRVYLNGSEYQGDIGSVPLSAGATTIEITCLSAGGEKVIGYTFEIGRITAAVHEAFLTSLSRFPESYRNKLMVLHSMHPEWVFEPFETGLDWNYVIDNQDKGTVSLIWKNIKPEYKKNDIIMDSSSFVTASRAAVEYYIDPRNFLNENNIFMFEQLSYSPERHTLEGVAKIIAATGLIGREQMFLDAGIESGVSPYHLAARSRQEVTAWNPIGLSPIASGNYVFEMTRDKADGTGTETYMDERYKGLYNFYNIGTGSSTDIGTLYRRGLNYARGFYAGSAPTYYGTLPNAKAELYRMPWDSEEKAITGGAFFIGDSYINKGQDTLYLQKFDVDNDPVFGVFKNQYMQNVQAPLHESSATYRTYVQMDNLGNNFTFEIPIFIDMPDNEIPLPENTGRLEDLGIEGYPSYPAFDPFFTGDYTITVPSDSENVIIGASGFDSRSVITGAGEKSLEYGENTFRITCTPPNGDTVEYKLIVTRNLPEKSNDNYLLSLSIRDIPFDRSFQITDTGEYKAKVAYDISSVEIIASARSDSAVVAGSGTVKLQPGMNKFAVTVTSENGRSRVYDLSVHRVIPELRSDMLKLENGNITGLELLSTAGVLKTSFTISAGTVEVYDNDGKAVPNNSSIGTGSIVRLLFNDEVIEEYVVVVFGDLNGDGKINSTDIALVRSAILRMRKLEGGYFTAADINKDGRINSTDLTFIRRHILRLKQIDQAA